MLSKKWAALLCLFFGVFPLKAGAQIGHLASFDDRLIHFGIQVGMTQSKFDVDFTLDDQVRESMQGVASYNAAGFHISVILPDLRISRFLSLRLLPGVTILNREIAYSWASAYASNPLSEPQRYVESVYGELPVEFKFRAMRCNNFRPYVTAGASYGFDFASLRKNKNNNAESIIRLNPSDFRYSAGVGVDFFLRYVAFAIEMKVLLGVVDLSVPDNDVYTLAVDRLTSRTFVISFIFEG